MAGARPAKPETTPSPVQQDFGNSAVTGNVVTPANALDTSISCAVTKAQLLKMYEAMKAKHEAQNEKATKKGRQANAILKEDQVIEQFPQMGTASLLRSTEILPTQAIQAMSVDVYEFIHGRRIPLENNEYISTTTEAQYTLELFEKLGQQIRTFNCQDYTTEAKAFQALRELYALLNLYQGYLQQREEELYKLEQGFEAAVAALGITATVGCNSGNLTYSVSFASPTLEIETQQHFTIQDTYLGTLGNV